MLSKMVKIPVKTTPPFMEKHKQHLSGHWGQEPPFSQQHISLFTTYVCVKGRDYHVDMDFFHITC